MRGLLQRVSSARVLVEDEVVGEIDCAANSTGQGLVVLVGVTHDDTPAKAVALAAKIAGLRILLGELSVADVGAPLLVISQFTLYADTRKGRRPTWSAAAPGPAAEPLVDAVVEALRTAGSSVATGRFGADMRVELVNDGPMTVLLEI